METWYIKRTTKDDDVFYIGPFSYADALFYATASRRFRDTGWNIIPECQAVSDAETNGLRIVSPLDGYELP